MTRELCPTCKVLRDMRVSTSERIVTEPGGEKKKIETISYHCAQCNQFVRSEDHEELTEE